MNVLFLSQCDYKEIVNGNKLMIDTARLQEGAALERKKLLLIKHLKMTLLNTLNITNYWYLYNNTSSIIL